MNFISMSLSNRFLKSFIILIFSAFTLISCEDNPNDLGLVFIPADDTTGVLYLDSELDTMNITNSNYKKFINNSVASSFMIGNYQNYQSKALLKFKDISPDYDSVTVTSATLTMKYNDYFFKDENGLTSFNIYRVNSNFNYSTVTWDSVTSSSIGTISLGSFNGTPQDTQSINITLDNQLAKDWLEAAADTGYINKNYGIAFIPDMSSSTIKGFYSNNNDANLIPYVSIYFLKNNVLDTITLITSEYVTLSDAPSGIIPQDRFILQNGIAYRNVLNFDLSKLPPNVIINNASLQFTLDNASSYISGSTANKSIILAMVSDSVNRIDSVFTDPVQVFPQDSVTYVASSIRFNTIFQNWNSGILPNFGISMKSFFELQNLDYFVFYSPSASDISKRPRLKITYTPRQ